MSIGSRIYEIGRTPFVFTAKAVDFVADGITHIPEAYRESEGSNLERMTYAPIRSWFESFKDNVAGQASMTNDMTPGESMFGMVMGPKGLIGATVEAIPEWAGPIPIRKTAGVIWTPFLENMQRVYKYGIDRPLGFLATVGNLWDLETRGETEPGGFTMPFSGGLIGQIPGVRSVLDGKPQDAPQRLLNMVPGNWQQDGYDAVTLNLDTYKDVWDVTESRSAGQAIILSQQKIDIFDPVSVQDFEGTLYYQMASGTVDLFLNLAGDPLYLAVKGVKLGYGLRQAQLQYAVTGEFRLPPNTVRAPFSLSDVRGKRRNARDRDEAAYQNLGSTPKWLKSPASNTSIQEVATQRPYMEVKQAVQDLLYETLEQTGYGATGISSKPIPEYTPVAGLDLNQTIETRRFELESLNKAGVIEQAEIVAGIVGDKLPPKKTTKANFVKWILEREFREKTTSPVSPADLDPVYLTTGEGPVSEIAYFADEPWETMKTQQVDQIMTAIGQELDALQKEFGTFDRDRLIWKILEGTPYNTLEDIATALDDLWHRRQGDPDYWADQSYVDDPNLLPGQMPLQQLYEAFEEMRFEDSYLGGEFRSDFPNGFFLDDEAIRGLGLDPADGPVPITAAMNTPRDLFETVILVDEPYRIEALLDYLGVHEFPDGTSVIDNFDEVTGNVGGGQKFVNWVERVLDLEDARYANSGPEIRAAQQRVGAARRELEALVERIPERIDDWDQFDDFADMTSVTEDNLLWLDNLLWSIQRPLSTREGRISWERPRSDSFFDFWGYGFDSQAIQRRSTERRIVDLERLQGTVDQKLLEFDQRNIRLMELKQDPLLVGGTADNPVFVPPISTPTELFIDRLALNIMRAGKAGRLGQRWRNMPHDQAYQRAKIWATLANVGPVDSTSWLPFDNFLKLEVNAPAARQAMESQAHFLAAMFGNADLQSFKFYLRRYATLTESIQDIQRALAFYGDPEMRSQAVPSPEDIRNPRYVGGPIDMTDELGLSDATAMGRTAYPTPERQLRELATVPFENYESFKELAEYKIRVLRQEQVFLNRQFQAEISTMTNKMRNFFDEFEPEALDEARYFGDDIEANQASQPSLGFEDIEEFVVPPMGTPEFDNLISQFDQLNKMPWNAILNVKEDLLKTLIEEQPQLFSGPDKIPGTVPKYQEIVKGSESLIQVTTDQILDMSGVPLSPTGMLPYLGAPNRLGFSARTFIERSERYNNFARSRAVRIVVDKVAQGLIDWRNPSHAYIQVERMMRDFERLADKDGVPLTEKLEAPHRIGWRESDIDAIARGAPFGKANVHYGFVIDDVLAELLNKTDDPLAMRALFEEVSERMLDIVVDAYADIRDPITGKRIIDNHKVVQILRGDMSAAEDLLKTSAERQDRIYGNSDVTTVEWINDGENIRRHIPIMPSQIQHTSIVPRFDMFQRLVNIVGDDYKTILDADGNPQRIHLGKSRAQVRVARRFMSTAWKRGVLLTPRWQMVVNIDSMLRTMAHVGAAATVGRLGNRMDTLQARWLRKSGVDVTRLVADEVAARINADGILTPELVLGEIERRYPELEYLGGGSITDLANDPLIRDMITKPEQAIHKMRLEERYNAGDQKYAARDLKRELSQEQLDEWGANVIEELEKRERGETPQPVEVDRTVSVMDLIDEILDKFRMEYGGEFGTRGRASYNQPEAIHMGAKGGIKLPEGTQPDVMSPDLDDAFRRMEMGDINHYEWIAADVRMGFSRGSQFVENVQQYNRLREFAPDHPALKETFDELVEGVIDSEYARGRRMRRIGLTTGVGLFFGGPVGAAVAGLAYSKYSRNSLQALARRTIANDYAQALRLEAYDSLDRLEKLDEAVLRGYMPEDFRIREFEALTDEELAMLDAGYEVAEVLGQAAKDRREAARLISTRADFIDDYQRNVVDAFRADQPELAGRFDEAAEILGDAGYGQTQFGNVSIDNAWGDIPQLQEVWERVNSANATARSVWAEETAAIRRSERSHATQQYDVEVIYEQEAFIASWNEYIAHHAQPQGPALGIPHRDFMRPFWEGKSDGEIFGWLQREGADVLERLPEQWQTPEGMRQLIESVRYETDTLVPNLPEFREVRAKLARGESVRWDADMAPVLERLKRDQDEYLDIVPGGLDPKALEADLAEAIKLRDEHEQLWNDVEAGRREMPDFEDGSWFNVAANLDQAIDNMQRNLEEIAAGGRRMTDRLSLEEFAEGVPPRARYSEQGGLFATQYQLEKEFPNATGIEINRRIRQMSMIERLRIAGKAQLSREVLEANGPGIGNSYWNSLVDFGKSIGTSDYMDAIQEISMRKRAVQLIDNFVTDRFENLTMVEDVISRGTMFEAVYERTMAEYLQRYRNPDSTYTINGNQLATITEKSRQQALFETKNVLYDLAERSRFEELMVELMPFLGAWQEVASRWVGLAAANPIFVARALRPWHLLTSEDEHGQTKLLFKLPPVFDTSVAGFKLFGPISMLTKENVDLKLSSASMIGAMPGTGPLFSFLATELVIQVPEMSEFVDWALPYGYAEGGNAVTRFLNVHAPSWVRSGLQQAGMDTNSRAATAARVTLDYLSELHENGVMVGDSAAERRALDEEVERRVKMVYGMRMFRSLAVPVSFRQQSPYWAIISEFQKIEDEHGAEIADYWLLENHADLWAYTGRKYAANGVVAGTLEGHQKYLAHQEFADRYPEVGAFITGAVGAIDVQFEYNRAVRDEEIRSGRKEYLDPGGILTEASESIGWREYRVFRNSLDGELRLRGDSGGSASLNAVSNFDLKTKKDQFVAELSAKNPVWASEFNDIGNFQTQGRILQAFREIVASEDFAYRPEIPVIEMFLNLHDSIGQEMVTRANIESNSNYLLLSYKKNDDLRQRWEIGLLSILRYPDFGPIYDRYFSKMESISTQNLPRRLELVEAN